VLDQVRRAQLIDDRVVPVAKPSANMRCRTCTASVLTGALVVMANLLVWLQ
jgi:hypothetical protein